MNAGDLDKRITIQRREVGRDTLGQPVDTWVDVCTVWANVRTPSGMEAIRAGADVSTTRLSIRIRYRAGLDAGMRVLHGGRAYGIKSALGDRRDGRVDIVAEAPNVAT